MAPTRRQSRSSRSKSEVDRTGLVDLVKRLPVYVRHEGNHRIQQDAVATLALSFNERQAFDLPAKYMYIQ